MENSETKNKDENADQAGSGTLEAAAAATPPGGKEENAGASAAQDPTDEDYIFKRILGEGSFSTVYLAKDIHHNKEFAVKVCQKRQIMREKKLNNILRERKILYYLNERTRQTAPFFVKLFCTFHDQQRLFFVLSYADNGDLLQYLTKLKTFETNCAQFYTAQILHAVEYLHSINIMHRDLKPENILLDANLHILLSDFGSAEFIENEEKSNASFEGTAHYIPPELLNDKISDKCCDLWALGCITYQMISGVPPFNGKSEYLVFQSILELDYDFPEQFAAVAKDFVLNMLRSDPEERLGSRDTDGYPSIKHHPLFEGIDFDTLYLEMSPLLVLKENAESDDDDKVDRYANLEPGLAPKQVARLNGLDTRFTTSSSSKKVKNQTPSANDKPPEEH